MTQGAATATLPAADPDGPAAPYRPVLSPSRAADFKVCPLRYRYRAIDHIPEPPAAAAVRGTLVHAVLEELFSLPAGDRTLAAAADRLVPAWEALLARRPEVAGLIEDGDCTAWFAAATALLRSYFELEDPTRLEPDACELRVEVTLPGDVPVKGIIDRLDVSPGGLLRVVDYKTGRSPAESYTSDVLYQLKFYALALYRLRGVVPARLRLVYLGDHQLLEYTPDEAELRAFERGVVALWQAIEKARSTGDFRPRRSRLCQWCTFQEMCPEFGGTVPPMPLGTLAG